MISITAIGKTLLHRLGIRRLKPISDKEFDETLDDIVRMTIDVVNEQSEPSYETTIFLLNEIEFGIIGLVHGEEDEDEDTGNEDEDADKVDPYDLLHDFGRALQQKGYHLDAVYVAAEAFDGDGGDSIMITGYTIDGRTNAAWIRLTRAADDALRVVDSRATHYQDKQDLNWRRNGAQEVIRGWTEGPDQSEEG